MLRLPTITVGFLLLLVSASSTLAWNALGHKVVAEIAWRQLSPEQRTSIVDTRRRHPRFDKDFLNKMDDDLQWANEAIEDRWIFQHAATWPDIARDIKGDERMRWDWPIWHYVNFPIFLERRGLGTFFANCLKRIGFKQRKGCGCGRREETLNKWGRRIFSVFRRR